MGTPYLSIDLTKIEHNAREVVSLCARHGIEVSAVTKGVCGHPQVARAMLRGGVSSLADSRLQNVRRLREAGLGGQLLLLRIPALSATAAVAGAVDVSLNSDLRVLARLSQAAEARGARHEVIIMVDLGDLREGVWPDDVVAFAREAARLPGIRIKGLGTNLACFSGLVPTAENMLEFVRLAGAVEAACSMELELLSAVNSSGLSLLAAGNMPERINHARIGEAILLGTETVAREPLPGTHQDAFLLHAEVLECRRKPSVAAGTRGEDAFGRTCEAEDRGDRLRALLNVGREDVDIANLHPLDPRLQILGASSGYLVLDVTEAGGEIDTGAELSFRLGYGALLRAMTSEYVEKRCL